MPGSGRRPAGGPHPGQQQGDQDADGAQEQAAADQRAHPGAVEHAAGQHADGRERSRTL